MGRGGATWRMAGNGCRGDLAVPDACMIERTPEVHFLMSVVLSSGTERSNFKIFARELLLALPTLLPLY